jgi:zinc D-Ala-D-Ala carboxypeptidase
MRTAVIVLSILLFCAVCTAGHLYYSLKQAEQQARTQETDFAGTLATKSEEYTQALAHIQELEALLSDTTSKLTNTEEEKETLAQDLSSEKERNDDFANQLSKLGSTVGTLDKLAKTDPELLMKYSKVYFLNEHYMPEKLSEIPKEFLYSEAEPKFIHAQVLPFLEDMIEDAADDDVTLWVKSAFRSYDEQEDLKGAYSVAYGSGANTFSADQGYSEHQLGTTVDFTTEGRGGGLDGFDATPAYTWLRAHAHEYGFILSYPHNNTYYIFEPWHWRFVGEDLADDLHDTKSNFYDLDQREIDTYLVSIFD